MSGGERLNTNVDLSASQLLTEVLLYGFFSILTRPVVQHRSLDVANFCHMAEIFWLSKDRQRDRRRFHEERPSMRHILN